MGLKLKDMEKSLIEKLEKLKEDYRSDFLFKESGYKEAIDDAIILVHEAIQALSQSESKPITKEEIEYRIKEEYKKHRNSSILVGDEFHWAKIAASKIYALLPQPPQTK